LTVIGTDFRIEGVHFSFWWGDGLAKNGAVERPPDDVENIARPSSPAALGAAFCA